jgi:hypothetical protein
MTIPIIYLEHRRWNIYDKKINLHAGFSWLGVGSFTSKERYVIVSERERARESERERERER